MIYHMDDSLTQLIIFICKSNRSKGIDQITINASCNNFYSVQLKIKFFSIVTWLN